MELYVNSVGGSIIRDKFGINAYLDIEEYEKFLTYDRRKEILKYKEYNLISPQIYNICYLFLTKRRKLNREDVIKVMENEVENNKKEMSIIIENNYTPQQYNEKSRKKVNEDIDWDIPEYELIRGDWNSNLV